MDIVKIDRYKSKEKKNKKKKQKKNKQRERCAGVLHTYCIACHIYIQSN